MTIHEHRDETQEEWRPVVGWEETHLVSNTGRVRRVKGESYRELKIHYDKWGYARVSLWTNSKRKTIPVHRLVATAFIGAVPTGMWVLHGPQGVRCNKVTNLSFGTPAQNTKDKIRDGTLAIGSRNGRAKLTVTDVRLIKEQLEQGICIAKLSRDFGVSRRAINWIRSGKNWAWM